MNSSYFVSYVWIPPQIKANNLIPIIYKTRTAKHHELNYYMRRNLLLHIRNGDTRKPEGLSSLAMWHLSFFLSFFLSTIQHPKTTHRYIRFATQTSAHCALGKGEKRQSTGVCNIAPVEPVPEIMKYSPQYDTLI